MTAAAVDRHLGERLLAALADDHSELFTRRHRLHQFGSPRPPPPQALTQTETGTGENPTPHQTRGWASDSLGMQSGCQWRAFDRRPLVEWQVSPSAFCVPRGCQLATLRLS